MPYRAAQTCCTSSQGSSGRQARAVGALAKENVDADGAEDAAGKGQAAGTTEDEAWRRSHADDSWGATVAALPSIKAFLHAAAVAKVGPGRSAYFLQQQRSLFGAYACGCDLVYKCGRLKATAFVFTRLLTQQCVCPPSVQVQEEAALRFAQMGRAAWPSSPLTALVALELVALLGFKRQLARSRGQGGGTAHAATLNVLDAMVQAEVEGAFTDAGKARHSASVKALLAQMSSTTLRVTFQSDE